MFAEITLSRRFPKTLGIFDYRIPDHLASRIRVGQLVRAPFRSSQVEGVVITVKARPIFGKKILALDDIVDNDPVLTDAQLNLARWISSYYCVSLGTVIKMMLPDIPHREKVLAVRWPEQFHPIPDTQPDFTLDVQKPTVLWFHQRHQHESWYAALLRVKKKQTLFIVPDIEDCEQIKKFISPEDREQVVFMHSKLRIGDMHNAWNRIRTGQAKIIIGTKIALFMPFLQLELIVVDREDDDTHKQYDQNPRFDARRVARELGVLMNSSVVYLTSAPTLDTYRSISTSAYQLIRKTDGRKGKTEIVDMRDERKKRNFSLVSDRLADAIQHALAGKKRIFLFLNKRGAAHIVECRDCKSIIHCPNCDRPLVLHREEKADVLKCHHCDFSKSLLSCPSCGSVQFRFASAGTQQLQADIERAYPLAKCMRIDQDTSDTQPDADIIIGTESSFSILALYEFAVIGVVSADTLFHVPDFSSSERTYRQLRSLLELAPSSAHCIIQTFSPENPVISSVEKNEPELFYTKELADRRVLHYPPFSTVLKLISGYKNATLAEQEAQKLALTLSRFGTSYVLKPYATAKIKHSPARVILKITDLGNERSNFSEIVQCIPNQWVIDRDPVSLLA